MDVTLNMKFLEHCEPGELVRAHFGLKVEWGIVADRQQQRRVVVISGNNAPWYLDPQGAVLSCLSYGRESHQRRCNQRRCRTSVSAQIGLTR